MIDNVEIDLIKIAATWSFWDRPVPESVPRSVDLPKELSDSLCLVIQGVRRCGKSTLLQQLIARYGLDPTYCAFVNFEDPRLASALSFETLDRLVELFRESRPHADRLYFFLDEIQWVEGWQRWLLTQLDRPQGNVFVLTGSNARLSSGELSSMLTGRHLTVELFPFDIGEMRVADPAATWADYLQRGGFPEPLRTPDGDRLRRQYFHDIIERDIRERLKARSSLPIRQVIQMAYESVGSELSLRRIAAATGLAVDTAASYLEASESAYLLFGCPFFALSQRKRSRRNKKYYPVDTGLRRVVATRIGSDRGKTFESAVHIALRRRFGTVCYWRERGEVDFVVSSGGLPVPIQVSWDQPSERHLKALDEFYERFPHAAEAVFVTADAPEAALARVAP